MNPSRDLCNRAKMKYTVFFQPRAKISGVVEGSATFDSAKEALREVDGLERSDEKVRIVDEKGAEISKALLEMYANRESD